MSIDKVARVTGMAAKTGLGDRLVQEMGIGRSVGSVAVETPFGLGSRKMGDLTLELLTDVGMTIRAQVQYGRAQERFCGAGVRLMTGGTLSRRRLVSRSTRRRGGGNIVAGCADLGGAGIEQTGGLGGVGQMAGVAVSGGVGFVLRKGLERFDEAVVTFLAEGLSVCLQ